jgi:hypothetical protein
MTALAVVGRANVREQLLETVAISNAAATATVSKAFQVPQWARYAIIVVDITITGTTPLFDFVVKQADVAALGYADSAHVASLGAAWDGITQKTTDGTHSISTIVIGPDIATDDTGSATANDNYGVLTPLPSWLMYSYTYDGTTHDEDYNGTITVYFTG